MNDYSKINNGVGNGNNGGAHSQKYFLNQTNFLNNMEEDDGN